MEKVNVVDHVVAHKALTIMLLCQAVVPVADIVRVEVMVLVVMVVVALLVDGADTVYIKLN